MMNLARRYVLLAIVSIMSIYSLLYLPIDVKMTQSKAESVTYDGYVNYMYIRSAFRVSDEEIRLSIVKDVENTNFLEYIYGKKKGEVLLECHQPTCPDFFSPPCTVNGYIGRILNLTIKDNAKLLKVRSKRGILTHITVEDVRKPKKNKNFNYPHTLGVCIQPMYYVTDYSLLIQFFEFWLSEGATMFYFYWESMSPQVWNLIEFYQRTSNAQITLVPWSRLPVKSDVSIEQNPNAYWFRLEVFLGIFDCMMRARYNVKYVGQTDLDEVIFINGSQTLIEYMEAMNEKHSSMVDVQFLSRRAYIKDTNDKLLHPFNFSFDAYSLFSVDANVFKKPLYTKMVHRPERDFKVHIHRSQPPEFIKGTNKRFEHVTAPSTEASIFHFRKQNGMYGTGKTFNTTAFNTTSKKWVKNFKKRQQSAKLSSSLNWVYSSPTWTHDLEICRQNQNKLRTQKCHNLYECEEQLNIEKHATLIRANNSWHFV